jgi:hypothetical protein
MINPELKRFYKLYPTCPKLQSSDSKNQITDRRELGEEVWNTLLAPSGGLPKRQGDHDGGERRLATE